MDVSNVGFTFIQAVEIFWAFYVVCLFYIYLCASCVCNIYLYHIAACPDKSAAGGAGQNQKSEEEAEGQAEETPR